MPIFRRAERPRFTQIDNDAVEDPQLSFKALGMLAYLLSKPDDWSVNYRHLATTHTDGETAVRAALKELEDGGYLVRQKEHGSDGRFGYVTLVYERPHRAAETPAWETPAWETTALVKTEVTKTEEQPSPTPDGAVPKPKRERPRDPAWDALVAAVGWEPKTKAESSRVGRAVREIVSALPDDTTRENVGKHIEARARRYREHWPRAELTPEALVKHWSKFAPGTRPPDPPAKAAPAPDRGTLTRGDLARRKGAEDRTWEEFVSSLEGLTEAEQEQERRARRDGLKEKIYFESGEIPARENGWFYEEGEKGWHKTATTPGTTLPVTPAGGL